MAEYVDYCPINKKYIVKGNQLSTISVFKIYALGL